MPDNLTTPLTGLVMSLGTQWGLFRHYWVLISLALTILCTVVLVLHMPTVSAMAKLARTVEGADLRALGGDLFHPAVGLLVLLAVAVLNVYKPAGVTPYGWRKQREQRTALQRSARRAMTSVSPTPVTSIDVHQTSRFSVTAAGVGYFTLYFAEMFVAMMRGMMVFIRGCSWRDGAEMSAVMLLPIAGVFVLRGIGLSGTLPWLSSSEHTAMLVGMLVLMLYRRERYTSGYSFRGWPTAAVGRRSTGAQLAEAGHQSARVGTG